MNVIMPPVPPDPAALVAALRAGDRAAAVAAADLVEAVGTVARLADALDGTASGALLDIVVGALEAAIVAAGRPSES